MYNHLMIDLETLGKNPGDIILSIGCAFFDPNEDYTDDFPDDIPLFYKNIDINSCIKNGLNLDGETLCWWMEQSKEATEALLNPKPENIEKVINEFNSWYFNHRAKLAEEQGIADPHEVDIFVWCHGATFDAPFWHVANKKCNKRVPWYYARVRDTRTILDLAFNKDHSGNFEGFGTAHNALHDSLKQIVWVQEAYKKLNIIAR